MCRISALTLALCVCNRVHLLNLINIFLSQVRLVKGSRAAVLANVLYSRRANNAVPRPAIVALGRQAGNDCVVNVDESNGTWSVVHTCMCVWGVGGCGGGVRVQ